MLTSCLILVVGTALAVLRFSGPVEYVHDSHSRIARFDEEELEDVETGRMSEKTPIATASRTNAPHYGAFTKGGAAKPVVCSYDRAH